MEIIKFLSIIVFVLLLGWIISNRTFSDEKIMFLTASHADRLIESINNEIYRKEVLINHSELYYGENEENDYEEFKHFLTTGILDKFDDRDVC